MLLIVFWANFFFHERTYIGAAKGWFPLSRIFSMRTLVNKIETNVWKAARKRKSWTPLNFYAYAWPFIHCLHFIYACEFYVRSHGKVTRQWISTLNNHFGEKKNLWSASAKGALSPVLNGNCAYFCNHYIRQCYFVDTKITLKVDFQIHLHNDSLRNELCPDIVSDHSEVSDDWLCNLCGLLAKHEVKMGEINIGQYWLRLGQ